MPKLQQEEGLIRRLALIDDACTEPSALGVADQVLDVVVGDGDEVCAPIRSEVSPHLRHEAVDDLAPLHAPVIGQPARAAATECPVLPRRPLARGTRLAAVDACRGHIGRVEVDDVEGAVDVREHVADDAAYGDAHVLRAGGRPRNGIGVDVGAQHLGAQPGGISADQAAATAKIEQCTAFHAIYRPEQDVGVARWRVDCVTDVHRLE